MKRWIWIGVFAVTGMIVWLVREVRDGDAQARPAAQARSGGEVTAAQPRGELAASRHAPPVVPVVPPHADARDDRAAASPGPEEVRDHLQSAFGADRPTAASQARTYTVEQGVRAALPAGSSIRSVECRGAMCRIETEHTSIDEFHEFIRRAFQTPESKIATAPVFAGPLAAPKPGAPLVAVAYLAREGTTLPMPAMPPPGDAQ